MKWGILATGTIAAKFAKTVAQMCSDNEKIVAVGSRDVKKAQEFADTYGIKIFVNYCKNVLTYRELFDNMKRI